MPAPPETVRAFYTDLANLSSVHPLVVEVRCTRRTPMLDGYRQCYRVTDRIPVGPFTLPITYRVQLTVPVTGEVTVEARQFPCVRLQTTVAFAPSSIGTRITERIRIEAPLPLAAITVGKAVAAHGEMLAGIRRYFS
ncbi:MAG TPA: SRPBCC family protein [Mycobacterium sp.]|nr:SRPBCC family protein [Mycobacterium sp.]